MKDDKRKTRYQRATSLDAELNSVLSDYMIDNPNTKAASIIREALSIYLKAKIPPEKYSEYLARFEKRYAHIGI